MQYMEEKGALLIWTLCSCTLLMMLVLNNLYISDVFLSNVWINLSQTHTILGVASTCSPLDWRHHLITCTHHAVSQVSAAGPPHLRVHTALLRFLHREICGWKTKWCGFAHLLTWRKDLKAPGYYFIHLPLQTYAPSSDRCQLGLVSFIFVLNKTWMWVQATGVTCCGCWCPCDFAKLKQVDRVSDSPYNLYSNELNS